MSNLVFPCLVSCKGITICLSNSYCSCFSCLVSSKNNGVLGVYQFTPSIVWGDNRSKLLQFFFNYKNASVLYITVQFISPSVPNDIKSINIRERYQQCRHPQFPLHATSMLLYQAKLLGNTVPFVLSLCVLQLVYRTANHSSEVEIQSGSSTS